MKQYKTKSEDIRQLKTEIFNKVNDLDFYTIEDRVIFCKELMFLEKVVNPLDYFIYTSLSI